MKVEKRIHTVWQELENTLKQFPQLDLSHHIGKYQYIYSSKKGIISLIELPNYFGNGHHLWEIYCLEGEIPGLEDILRFDSKEEAEIEIKKLIG